jgi:hypothetical protein
LVELPGFDDLLDLGGTGEEIVVLFAREILELQVVAHEQPPWGNDFKKGYIIESAGSLRKSGAVGREGTNLAGIVWRNRVWQQE